jgi:hypothetical protein
MVEPGRDSEMELATGLPSVLCVTGRLSTAPTALGDSRNDWEDDDVWKAPPIEHSTD